MAEIKRYTTAQIISQKLGCEFVKYDDVKHLLDQPKCNCEEMIGMWRKLEWEGINRQKACGQVYIVNNKTEFTWLCPAHGYKRR